MAACLVGFAACDSEESGDEGGEVTTEERDTAADDLRREREKLRAERAKLRRERVRARRARAEAKRQRERRERQQALQAQREQEQQEQAQQCHPSYDPCLDPNASDYDCEGGEGDGPEYVAGPVTVTGDDPFDLDRDGDGTGCDSS
jgi:hypothetical protein